MPLYTRTGDDGFTGLFGGGRVGKDHPRVEAYGTIDELNACLGVVGAACTTEAEWTVRFRAIIDQLQSRLFDLGADLATPADSPHADKIKRVTEALAATVETWIDEVESGNEPLTQFVLPGGTDLSSRLHLARAVCRRAERRLITLAHGNEVNPAAIVFVNRVGDLLFAMARRANRESGVADVPWVPEP
jgi:cob(I)alamin adenosyltransferase